MKSVFRAVATLLAALAITMNPAFAKDAVSIKGKKGLAEAQQVAVAAFNVGFIFESTDQTKKTGGLMGAFGGVTKAKSELVGVTPEMMQQVADAAYADFIAKLSAAGIGIVPADALFADANIQKAADGTGPMEAKIQLEKKSKGVATFVKPSALAGQIVLQGDLAEKSGGLTAFGKGFSDGRRQAAVDAYVRESGVPVVSVVYLVDFSDQKRPGAFSIGGGLKVNANLSIVPDYSKATIIGPKGRSVLTLEQQVSVDGEFIEASDATGGNEKTAQAAANIGGGLAAAAGVGLPMIGKTRKFAFEAKPGNYEEGAAKAAQMANDLIVGAFMTLR